MKRSENVIGQKYSRLTITYEMEKRWEKRYFSCLCDCWSITSASLNNLRTWEVWSCWCIKKEMLADSKYIHWMSGSKIYYVRWAMLKRCIKNNDKSFKNYWWRWISVDPEWLKFENFFRDMWPTYKEWLTIDRINNDWNYCKDNCKRETIVNQVRNRRVTVCFNWVPIAKIAEDTWIKYSIIYNMLRKWKMNILAQMQLKQAKWLKAKVTAKKSYNQWNLLCNKSV
jgi:hypothetical protein